MKELFLVLLAGLLLISAKSPDSEGVEFFEGTYTSAKRKAAEEGKLFFIDFTATWCTPCRWMEETTFTDPTLAAYVKENYVALKVDIDDFDGYALKQAYNIQVLPSLLIFDSQGTLLSQYEESLSPSNMLKILKKFDLPQNRVMKKPLVQNQVVNNYQPTLQPTTQVVTRPSIQPIVQPTTQTVVQSQTTTQNNETSGMDLPATLMMNNQQAGNQPVEYTSESMVSNNNSPEVGRITRKPLVKKEKQLFSIQETQIKETTNPNLHSTPTTDYSSEPVGYATNAHVETTVETPETYSELGTSSLTELDPNFDSGEGLYRFQVHRQSSVGFSIQVGAFSEYDNVMRQAALMQQHFDEPLIVHISKNNYRTLYKLMLGEFQTRGGAINFMRTVQSKGVDCMIKNLASY